MWQDRALCFRIVRANWLSIVAAAPLVWVANAQADPPLPTFASTIYNVAISNPSINGGTPASTAASDNAAALNAYITYCSTHGGGTVEIPAGTFLSRTLTMKSNVNLQIDGGAILRDTSINNTLITCSSGSNMQISGGGIIDGAATTTVGTANLVSLRGVNTLAILNVSIQNAAHEHLTPINDTNVTISGVIISDPGTLAANGGKYLANTDAIDYDGNNFLIKNCNISCGDDDIVAKPASFACNNITITGCTIGAGHGISVGGGSAKGVTNLTVTNCTMNGTDNGLRLKAADVPLSDQDAGGGLANPVRNVTYSHLTMNNVKNPIVIDSFYDNGSNNFPISPTDAASYPASPTPVGSTTPIWQNILFQDITATGSLNGGLIYGLNTTPNNLDGLTFDDVNISASSHMNLWYADNVDLSGLTVNVPKGDAFANASPVHGVNLFAVSTVPEPAAAVLMMLGGVALLKHYDRRRRSI